MRIGLVTCRVLPEPDPDAKPLADALQARGHTPIDVPWDEEESDLAGFDLFVIRSCWNYYEDPNRFLDWTNRASRFAPILNSPKVVKWNIHKSYLQQLAQAGVPVVETVLILGENADDNDRVTVELRNTMERLGDVVIKPAIGAASVGAKRFRCDDVAAAVRHAFAINANDVIIQPYIAGFADPGERSLIWIDGKWTHAVRKHPRFSGQHERVEAGEPPTDTELAVAQAAIAQVPYPIYYARADMVTSESGELLLSELELMEPSLFFDHSPEALERFVAMIESQARRHQ